MWRQQAEAEGLTLLEDDNKTGYFGVPRTVAILRFVISICARIGHEAMKNHASRGTLCSIFRQRV